MVKALLEHLQGTFNSLYVSPYEILLICTCFVYILSEAIIVLFEIHECTEETVNPLGNRCDCPPRPGFEFSTLQARYSMTFCGILQCVACDSHYKYPSGDILSGFATGNG